MKSSIDALGRVVVPKPIREKLHLRGPTPVEIEERDGAVVIRPATADVQLVETPEGPVAAAVGDVPPLTDADVRDALEHVRR